MLIQNIFSPNFTKFPINVYYNLLWIPKSWDEIEDDRAYIYIACVDGNS